MPDKDEVPGSSPGRPTTHRRRSQRCWQRAGRARRRLGPRWGRTPIPAGTSSGPAGAAQPGVRLGDDHAAWSRAQPRTAATRPVRPPRAAAGFRAHRAAAGDGRSDRRPGLPGRSAGTRGRRGPHPTRRPGSATDLPLTNATWAASPASPPPRPSIEPSTAWQPPGPPPVPVVRVARPARPGPQRHRLSMEETDASGRGPTPDGWIPHGWTADGWTGGQHPSDRRTLWTTTPGDRTAGQPDPGR
jgi:hypothetical protein